MGLFGALFAGVAGLGSQSNKIGIVSNNISNVNTVGYKQGSAAFNTLVVPSASTGTFSPGGVLGNNRQLVTQQGLIQATTSVTDVAISGGGLFVVNTKADGSGDTLYTRAGSFSQDASGNFRNAAGFFLQGLRVQTPALSVNPGNLTTINVNQNATGTSVATSLIAIAANFNATQAALPGAGVVATLANDSTNSTNSVTQILIPTTGTSGNGLQRGDAFDVSINAGVNTFSFTYGGFSIGRDVTSTTTTGDGGFLLNTQTVTTGIDTYGTGATDGSTSSAINGIDVANTTTDDVVTNGPFAAGTLTIDSIAVTVNNGNTLEDIRAAIELAIDTANGTATSTATITGNAGNYSIVITDTGTAAGAGVNSSSFALSNGTATFSLAGPYAINDENEITITLPTANTARQYTVGRTAYIDGITGTVGGLAASAINGRNLVVTSVNTATNEITLRLPTPTTVVGAASGEGGTAITISNRTFDYDGNMLDAANDSDDLLGVTGTSGFATGATTFSATVDGNSYTFNYNATPNTSIGQFNNLTALVTAINASSDGNITASLVDHQLYISPTDTSQAVTFTNGNAAGSGTTPGIDWIQELGLENIAAAGAGVNRFNSMQSLADQVNLVDPTTLKATISGRSVNINAVDPQASIIFSDNPANEGDSVISALGFEGAGGSNITGNPVTMTGGGTGYSTGTFTSVYDAADETKNMSSGAVTAQFTKDITIYDALGINHTISMNVLKLSTNTWAVEFTAVPASDVISANGTTATDGLITSGVVTFAGDGTLSNVNGLGNGSNISINWNSSGGSGSGSNPSSVLFNVGTSGLTDGLTQFAGSSNVSLADQNGSPTGQLTGVSIDANGFVTASFSNGQTQNLYQIPLASVNNPNGLNSVSGNAYKQTLDSGQVSISLAGTNGTGTLAASALEQSNVDLSTQLTDLIVAQQAYGANTRVLTVTSQLLQQLNQIVQ